MSNQLSDGPLAPVSLLPFGLSFGAAGAALAGWRPRLVALATLAMSMPYLWLRYFLLG